MKVKDVLSRFTLIIIVMFSFGSTMNAQELSMFQGPFNQLFFEDDQKISKKEFVSRINSVPESAMTWKKYKSNSVISVVSSVATGGALAWWITREEGDSTTAPILASLGGFIISSIFQSKALKYQREAILGYNQSKTGAYKISPSDHGIGLTLHF